MLDAIADARAHDRLPDVRLLERRDRHASSRDALAERGAGRRSGAGAARRAGARTRWSASSSTSWTAAGVHGPLVPPAAPVSRRHRQPPHAPQGDGRSTKRSGSPAASASPTSGGRRPRTSTSGATRTSASGARRSTACGPRSSTTGPRPTRSCSTRRVDRFPDQPQARRRRWCNACAAPRRPDRSDVATLFRTLLQIARATASASPPRTSSPTTSSRSGSATPRTAASRCRSSCPVRTPTSGSCSSRAKRCIPSCSTPASSSGTSNRR